MIPAIVLAAALVRFVVPAVEADTSDGAATCAPSTRPARDVDSLWAWMQVQHNPRARLIHAMSVRGMEGVSMALSFPTDSVATIWLVTSDATGNRSCPAYAGINLTLDTVRGERPKAAPKKEWFDLSGRRVERPMHSGMYIERTGTTSRIVVVLR